MSSFSSYNNIEHHENRSGEGLRLEPILFVVLIFTYITWKLNLTKESARLPKSAITDKSPNQLEDIPTLKHSWFPFDIPFIHGLITIYKVRREGVRSLADFVSKYGLLVGGNFITLKVYAVFDPEIVQKVLRSTNPLHMSKPQYLYGKVFVAWLRDGLVNSDYNLWHGRRKMVARSFTYKSLQSYAKLMNNHSRNLVRDLWKYSSTEEFQVSGNQVWHSLHFHAIKIIGQIAMGADKFSDTETTNFYHNFVGFKRIIVERVMNPLLFIPLYWHLHPIKKEFTAIVNDCQTFFDKMIGTYRREFEEKKSLKQPQEEEIAVDDVEEKPFRCLMEEMLQCGATDEEICSEFATFIMAGHETTVTALQFLLVHLATNPIHLKICQEEIDALMESKGLPGPGENSLFSDTGVVVLDLDDLSSLEYLNRCIMESNRIHPALPMIGRRLDAPLQVSENLTFPAGSAIGISPYISHRNPKYFPEPERFDPDRFLPEKIKQRHPFAYIPFSGGSRNCVGYKMAMMEMKVIMAWILYHFDVYTTDKFEDVKLIFQGSLMPERNYNLILKRRL